MQTSLGITTRLHTDIETAEALVTEALKAEGFGVLTEIDVRATLRKKLDVDFRPYKILGACNPALAYRALNAEPGIGLLLPCNVTLEEVEQGIIEVSAIAPLAMMRMVNSPDLDSIAQEANERLQRAIDSLTA